MSRTLTDEEIPSNSLPPVICVNPRIKIEPEQVDPSTLVLARIPHKEKSKIKIHLAPVSVKEPDQQSPLYPLAIIWSPDRIYFELNKEPVIRKLSIWNGCTRTIYIHCCGFWDNTAALLGASWHTCPRTRFLLAPGLKAELSVKATPRFLSPVPCAYFGLQLAASHKRDMVTGCFAVPIIVQFLNYKPSGLDEVG